MNNYSNCFIALQNKSVCWTWQELLFGIKHNIIEIEDIIYYSNEIISEDDDDFETIMQILIVDIDEVEPIVEKLALKEEKQLEDDIVSKWIFMIIYFYYLTNRNIVFDMIDEIYSDFDYPPEISGLVPYMPKEDGNSIDDNLNKYITNGEDKWIIKK